MSVLSIMSQNTISEVQNLFNKIFPFLKIEFYHLLKNGKERLENQNTMLRDIPCVKKFRKVKVDSTVSVSEFENYFSCECGLYIQIFRKSGPIWLGTTETRNWTLERQNLEAEILEELFKPDSQPN